MRPRLPKSMPHPHSMGSNNNPTTLIAAMVTAEDAVVVDVHAVHAVVGVVEPWCLLPFRKWGPTSRTSPRESIRLNVTCISPTSSKRMPIRMCATCAVLMWKIGTQVPRATKKTRAIRMVSLVPTTWNTSVQIIPSAERQCTRQCTPAASDSVGQ
jgi:hypothetical protein